MIQLCFTWGGKELSPGKRGWDGLGEVGSNRRERYNSVKKSSILIDTLAIRISSCAAIKNSYRYRGGRSPRCDIFSFLDESRPERERHMVMTLTHLPLPSEMNQEGKRRKKKKEASCPHERMDL